MYFESVIASVSIGILLGVGGGFYYRRIFAAALAPDSDTRLMESDAQHKESLASQVCVWDPHSCMNALNRLTIEASGEQEETLFALAEHMKFLAILIRNDGWCHVEHMNEWLAAWLELHFILHRGRSRPQLQIDIPPQTSRVDTRPIGHLMLSHLAHAGPLVSLSLKFSVMPPSEYPQMLEDDLAYLWLDCVMVNDVAQTNGFVKVGAPAVAREEFSTRCLALQTSRS